MKLTKRSAELEEAQQKLAASTAKQNEYADHLQEQLKQLRRCIKKLKYYKQSEITLLTIFFQLRTRADFT